MTGAGEFPLGDTVRFCAIPNPGWVFTGWSRYFDCDAGVRGEIRSVLFEGKDLTEVCGDVVMDCDKLAVAHFTENPSILTLEARPPEAAAKLEGAGTYDAMQVVQYKTAPKTGWEFLYWTEDLPGAGYAKESPEGNVTMDRKTKHGIAWFKDACTPKDGNLTCIVPVDTRYDHKKWIDFNGNIKIETNEVNLTGPSFNFEPTLVDGKLVASVCGNVTTCDYVLTSNATCGGTDPTPYTSSNATWAYCGNTTITCADYCNPIITTPGYWEWSVWSPPVRDDKDGRCYLVKTRYQVNYIPPTCCSPDLPQEIKDKEPYCCGADVPPLDPETLRWEITCSNTVTLVLESSPPEAAATLVGAGTYNVGVIAEYDTTPNSGWEFKNWSVDLPGAPKKSKVYMDNNKKGVANFVSPTPTPTPTPTPHRR